MSPSHPLIYSPAVYNHTLEADDKDPYLVSFRGIDNRTYYMTDLSQPTQLINWSGCGNTVNANHPVVTQLIIDSLVHWVTEYHVDGFRFDLASCLCRDEKGHPMAVPPLIKSIAKHPILSKVKLIAEPWDLGMYQVGSFPNWDVWAEWNGKYRDDIRRFIKGDAGMKKVRQASTGLVHISSPSPQFGLLISCSIKHRHLQRGLQGLLISTTSTLESRTTQSTLWLLTMVSPSMTSWLTTESTMMPTAKATGTGQTTTSVGTAELRVLPATVVSSPLDTDRCVTSCWP